MPEVFLISLPSEVRRPEMVKLGMLKLNAKQLRVLKQPPPAGNPKNELYIILDNVLDTYNIGSVFRLADAVGARRVYLCAGTAIPPNHRIKKASVNTMEVVEWEYCETAREAVEKLRREVPGISVVAIEQADKSTPFYKYKYNLPMALVVGHESEGVSLEVLAAADGIVELPLMGVNISLNVMVSLGIVLYKVLEETLLT